MRGPPPRTVHEKTPSTVPQGAPGPSIRGPPKHSPQGPQDRPLEDPSALSLKDPQNHPRTPQHCPPSIPRTVYQRTPPSTVPQGPPGLSIRDPPALSFKGPCTFHQATSSLVHQRTPSPQDEQPGNRGLQIWVAVSINSGVYFWISSLSSLQCSYLSEFRVKYDCEPVSEFGVQVLGMKCPPRQGWSTCSSHSRPQRRVCSRADRAAPPAGSTGHSLQCTCTSSPLQLGTQPQL